MARDTSLSTGGIGGAISKRLDALEAEVKRLKNTTTSTTQQSAITAIVDPIEGEYVVDPTDNKLKWYSNGAWREPTGTSVPLILDYFDNSYNPSGLAGVGNPGTIESTNWVKWREEANWSGYPNPIIGVDDITTGNDSYGNPKQYRWIYVPTPAGTVPLIKVEMSLYPIVETPGRWWDLNIRYNRGAPGAWNTEIGNPWYFSYGVIKTLPFQSLPSPRLGLYHGVTYYVQVNNSGYTHYGIGAQVYQTYPNSNPLDYVQAPYVQCVVTIVKNNVWDGEFLG